MALRRGRIKLRFIVEVMLVVHATKLRDQGRRQGQHSSNDMALPTSQALRLSFTHFSIASHGNHRIKLQIWLPCCAGSIRRAGPLGAHVSHNIDVVALGKARQGMEHRSSGFNGIIAAWHITLWVQHRHDKQQQQGLLQHCTAVLPKAALTGSSGLGISSK